MLGEISTRLRNRPGIPRDGRFLLLSTASPSLAARLSRTSNRLECHPPAARGLRWFTLQLKLSNSGRIHEIGWVVRWTEALKLS